MLDYPFTSPIYLGLTIVYFLVASIVTFDIRLIQARRQGENYPILPSWTGIFGWLQWAIFIVLFVLNWKYALIIFVVKFILKVLPVLETIGNILMSPFRPKESDKLERIGKELYEKTGINYQDALADMQKGQEEFREGQFRNDTKIDERD